MGFVGEVLDNVKGVQYFYIAGILIFLILFVVILVRTVRMPKKEIDDIKTSILDDGTIDVALDKVK